MTKLLFDVPEASEFSNIGPAQIRKEIKAGRLQARRVGKRILMTLDDLKAWAEALPRVAA
jgi:excisionase family DNA binding protein